MHSALDNTHVASNYLEAEMSWGVVLGLFAPDKVPGVHINRFGAIPKSHQPGKWRLIVDLSHPEGKRVNDGISSELCKLQYTRVDHIIQQLLQMGQEHLW